MEQDRYARLKRLVAEAVELPEPERGGFLVETCGADAEMLAEARELLAFDRPEAQGRTLTLTGGVDLPDMTGRTIGRYRIIELIGEGGMGVVYLAGQSAPLRRKVALKVIKFGMDTREVITRFESERQALALMDHPNIAKVLDAGATEQGRPYFVMEYIPGIPLTKYCERHALGLRRRLDLFIHVCRGIQHAHQKGVIHRDIKPGNILVTEFEGRPVPKIIDFGVAKATGQHLAAQTMFTQQGRIIGTPEYMSPEQADVASADVDTRSDVYSLGVVLYELLTGLLPVERRDILRAGFQQMGFHVQNELPHKPSTRIHTLDREGQGAATGFGSDTRSWERRVRGDLDWVTMKALEKERERRYGSPAEMAADLERHLADQPVQAGPPSGVYRLRKFVRRNRAGVMVGMLLLAALLAGVLGTSIGMVRALQAEKAATVSANRAEASNLYQVARAQVEPALGLSYITKALEYDDRPVYRDFARRLALKSPPLFLLPRAEHAGLPAAMEFSADGRRLAVGWMNGGVLQLYSDGAQDPVLLQGHRGNVNQVRFTGDSRMLVTAARDSTVRIWSTGSGEPLRVIRVPGLNEIYIDDVRQRLVTVTVVEGAPRLCRTWSLDGGFSAEPGHCGPMVPNALAAPTTAYDPVFDRLAIPVANRVELYDLSKLAAGTPRTIAVQDQPIRGVAFAPDGRSLVSFDDDGEAFLWDVDGADDRYVRDLRVGPSPLGARFDVTGRHLVICSYQNVSLWDLDLPASAAPLVMPSEYWFASPAFHPNGDWFVAVGTLRRVNAWPLKWSRPLSLQLCSGEDAVLRFSPDGRWLIAATEGGDVQAWPLDGRDVGTPRILFRADGYGYSWLRFDDTSRYVFAATCNSRQGAGVVVRVRLNDGESAEWQGLTCSFNLDATGRYVAAQASAGMGHDFVQVLDTETGSRIHLDQPEGGATKVIGFRRDGMLLAGGPAGLRLWNPADGTSEYLGPDSPAATLCRDRETILSLDRQGRMYRSTVTDSGRTSLPVQFECRNYGGFDVDSLGTRVLAACSSGDLELLDQENGRYQRLPLFDDTYAGIALDPKGRWIAGAGNGVVKLMPLPLEGAWADLSYEDLLARLRGLTNVRAVRSDKTDTGYLLDWEGVPDWDDPPGS